MSKLEKFKKGEVIFFVNEKGRNILFMVYEHIVDEKIDLIPLWNGLKSDTLSNLHVHHKDVYLRTIRQVRHNEHPYEHIV